MPKKLFVGSLSWNVNDKEIDGRPIKVNVAHDKRRDEGARGDRDRW